jgi:hypothetical protein
MFDCVVVSDSFFVRHHFYTGYFLVFGHYFFIRNLFVITFTFNGLFHASFYPFISLILLSSLVCLSSSSILTTKGTTLYILLSNHSTSLQSLTLHGTTLYNLLLLRLNYIRLNYSRSLQLVNNTVFFDIFISIYNLGASPDISISNHSGRLGYS